MNLPQHWRLVRISELCLINPSLEKIDRLQDDDLISFVPMSAVDENFGQITKPEIRSYKEVSKGFTPFKDGDVLFAKITPSMENGKTAIARNLKNGIGFGSTEFHVLRPCKFLLADYLFFFIRQQHFRKWAKYSFVGSAGQQRVPQNFFGRVPFPLPPIIEQQRIVDILKQVDRLRFLRNEGNSQINKLRFKLFYDFFGELNTKSSRWQNTAIGQVSKISYGLPEKLDTSLTRKDGYRILTISNVKKDGYFDLSVERFVPIDEEKIPAVNVEKNDLLFNWRSGSPEHVGKTVIWETDNDDPLLHVSFLLKIRPNMELVDPYYLWVLLNLIRKIGFFSKFGRKQVNTKFNATELGKLEIPVPPLVLQKEFGTQIRQLQETRTKMYQLTDDLFDFKGDITIFAFTGELTQLWRMANRNELEATAVERDATLGIIKKKIVIKEHAPEDRPWLGQPNRHWLMEQLSELQGFVYEALREWKGTLIPSEDLETFREEAFPIEHLEDANDQILRALHQLAGLGLIAKICLYNHEGDYVTAFRGLREEELSQVPDRQYLAKG